MSGKIILLQKFLKYYEILTKNLDKGKLLGQNFCSSNLKLHQQKTKRSFFQEKKY